MTAARLHPDDLAAIIIGVTEGVLSARDWSCPGSRSSAAVGRRETQAERPEVLLTAREVAARFGVSAEWVRDHQAELGVVRLGDGPRPRLRFESGKVAEALTRRSESERPAEADPPVAPGERTSVAPADVGSALDSLPVRELQPRATTRKAAGRRANAPGPATRAVASPRPERTPAGSSSAARERPRKEA